MGFFNDQTDDCVYSARFAKDFKCTAACANQHDNGKDRSKTLHDRRRQVYEVERGLSNSRIARHVNGRTAVYGYILKSTRRDQMSEQNREEDDEGNHDQRVDVTDPALSIRSAMIVSHD